MLIRSLRYWRLQKCIKQGVRALDALRFGDLFFVGLDPCLVGNSRHGGIAASEVPARHLLPLEFQAEKFLVELPDRDRAAHWKAKILELQRRLFCRW